MRFAVVSFPGSNCDFDCVRVVREVLCQPARLVWHTEHDLGAVDVVLLPGGFSYGDYLRCGAIAARAPVMEAVRRFAAAGGPVLGICNGFQVLTEAGLLPGALGRNRGLDFVCADQWLLVDGRETPFTRGAPRDRAIKVPIAHHDGRYFADAETLDRLEGSGQVVFRYATASGEVRAEANPNGSAHNIAGICNAAGNVVGMMPHPERAAESLLGGVDGRMLLEGAIGALA